jgi:hypothetical protein
MSTDKSKSESKTNLDSGGWHVFIEHAESEIIACQERIAKLRKSLRFFEKQRDEGIQFPWPKGTRHSKIS